MSTATKKAPAKKAPAKAKTSRSKYPWSKWVDGKSHTIKKGTHFSVDAEVMRGQVIVRARAEGREVDTSVKGDSVTFKFGPVVKDPYKRPDKKKAS